MSKVDATPTFVAGWRLARLAIAALAFVSIAAAMAIGALIAHERRAPPAAAAIDPLRAGNPDNETILARVEQLRQRLEKTPNDVEGWKMLARSLQALGRHGDAVGAYSQAAKLAPNDAESQSALVRLKDIARQRGTHTD